MHAIVKARGGQRLKWFAVFERRMLIAYPVSQKFDSNAINDVPVGYLRPPCSHLIVDFESIDSSTANMQLRMKPKDCEWQSAN